MHIAEVEAEAHRLLAQLVETLPGDLGQIAGRVVGAKTGDAPTNGAYPRTCANSDLPDGMAATSSAPANPIPWAARVLALCCEAYDQPVERAVPVAACLELLGIVSSALDAVQDGHQDLVEIYAQEPAKDNRQVGESRHQMALVTNTGVALIELAWQALLEYGPRYGVPASDVIQIGQLIARRSANICYAQHLDLTAGRSLSITLEEYDQIIAGKAGEIGGTACEAGALLAGAYGQRGQWHALGAERTIAQQLCDDHVDLEPDLTSGQQVSHPVLYGLSVPDQQQRQAIRALCEQASGETITAQKARQELLQILGDIGATHYTLACLNLHRRRALAALDELRLPPHVHRWLEQWVLRTAPSPRTTRRSEC